jgi:hypothetical protein
VQQHERLFRNSGMENRLSDEKDLCVMASPVERDRLTRLLEGPFPLFFSGTGARLGARSLFLIGRSKRQFP